MTTKTNFSDGIIKTLALMSYNSESFFLHDGVYYVGNLADVQANYEESTYNTYSDLSAYVENECVQVEEYDEDNNNYLVLSGEEADKKASEYIKDSLWAFTPSFLAWHTDLPEEVFTAIQDNGKCESNNDAIEQIINKCGGMGSFISEAIRADGRGHFMSSYDGNENEESIKVDNENFTFYIYRIN